MEVDSLDEYAQRMATPHVQAFFGHLHARYTCHPRWTQASSRGPEEQIIAAPLDYDRYSPQIVVSADGLAYLAEYASRVSSVASKIGPQGKPGQLGYVTLTASVSVALEVRGTMKYLSTDGSMPGFLCQAERCVLQDGSICYRLSTNAGPLWLREKSDNGLVATFCRYDPPLGGAVESVHLADTICYKPRLSSSSTGSGPWTGFNTHDESGREWRVTTSRLGFSAMLRLGVGGRYKNWNAPTILQPPYDAIWQPDGPGGFGVPLELLASQP